MIVGWGVISSKVIAPMSLLHLPTPMTQGRLKQVQVDGPRGHGPQFIVEVGEASRLSMQIAGRFVGPST